MPSIRVRTIMPKSGPLLEITTSDKTGMVRIQVVEAGETTRKVHVIEAFFGSFLGEMNCGQSDTPPLGLPMGKRAETLMKRGWVVVGSPSGEEHAILMFRVDAGDPVVCDLPIIAMCRLVEHVATGAHDDASSQKETVASD